MASWVKSTDSNSLVWIPEKADSRQAVKSDVNHTQATPLYNELSLELLGVALEVVLGLD